MNGHNVNTLRFRPSSPVGNVGRSSILRVRRLARLTGSMFASEVTFRIRLHRRKEGVLSVLGIKASTKNTGPGTVVTCGSVAKRMHSKRMGTPRKFKC